MKNKLPGITVDSVDMRLAKILLNRIKVTFMCSTKKFGEEKQNTGDRWT